MIMKYSGTWQIYFVESTILDMPKIKDRLQAVDRLILEENFVTPNDTSSS